MKCSYEITEGTDYIRVCN